MFVTARRSVDTCDDKVVRGLNGRGNRLCHPTSAVPRTSGLADVFGRGGLVNNVGGVLLEEDGKLEGGGGETLAGYIFGGREMLRVKEDGKLEGGGDTLAEYIFCGREKLGA